MEATVVSIPEEAAETAVLKVLQVDVGVLTLIVVWLAMVEVGGEEVGAACCSCSTVLMTGEGVVTWLLSSSTATGFALL